MSGPFDKELASLRRSNRPQYTKSGHDPDGSRLQATLNAAKSSGYETKHYVDTDAATEVKLHHPGLGHTVRAYRHKVSKKLHLTHSEDYGKAASRARPVKENKYELTLKEETEVAEETKTFEEARKVVDAILDGNAADATELFSDLVGERAFELVQSTRDELSKSVFDFTQQEPVQEEEVEDEEVPAEETDEDEEVDGEE